MEVTQPVTNNVPRARRGISGSTIKLIAIISMLIDHIAAGILGRYLSIGGIGNLDMNDIGGVNEWMDQNAMLYGAYNIMRLIGRLGFPIFCFLLIEGFEHTHSRKKYAVRLFVFALISEVPFDLLFRGAWMDFSYQNVFFTLFIGLLTMMAYHWVQEHETWHPLVKTLCCVAAVAAGMVAAQLLETDYAAVGVFCIMVLFIFRNKKRWQLVAGCLAFMWELTAPLAFVPIGFYNGRRGWNIKYLFYAFYPVHILVLYLICVALGIAGYPAM